MNVIVRAVWRCCLRRRTSRGRRTCGTCGRGAIGARLARRIGDAFVIGAVAPEAQVDPKGFRKACRKAERRLAEVEA